MSMKENIELVWEATSRLTDNFHIWNNSKKVEYRGWIFVPIFICTALLRKICSTNEFPIELNILYEDFEELGEKETRSFLDRVMADDKEMLNLVDQLFNHANTRLKIYELNYRWNLLEKLLFGLKSQDF